MRTKSKIICHLHVSGVQYISLVHKYINQRKVVLAQVCSGVLLKEKFCYTIKTANHTKRGHQRTLPQILTLRLKSLESFLIKGQTLQTGCKTTIFTALDEYRSSLFHFTLTNLLRKFCPVRYLIIAKQKDFFVILQSLIGVC